MIQEMASPETVSSPGDETAEAIAELEQAIVANVADERLLLGRLRALRVAHRAGRPWRAILREEPAPTAVSLSARVTQRLGAATRLLRRTLALSLLREGATTSEVAGHFDVSRQRVSHLVRNVPPAGRTR
jgi:hypothetical protein